MFLDQLTHTLGPFTCHHSQTVRNPGNSSFKLEKQVFRVVKTSFYQFREVAKPYFPPKDLQKLMPSTPLDWTTVVLLVQIAAVCLLTGVRRYDHITPVLSNLHWLPVHYRAYFKMLLPTFSFMF